MMRAAESIVAGDAGYLRDPETGEELKYRRITTQMSRLDLS
jgi:hypothetical protein